MSLWTNSYRVTVQMKATERYSLVLLFITLYKVVLTFESVDANSYRVTVQMKATERYSLVLLFIMLYNVVLAFESADEFLWCNHSNESY